MKIGSSALGRCICASLAVAVASISVPSVSSLSSSLSSSSSSSEAANNSNNNNNNSSSSSNCHKTFSAVLNKFQSFRASSVSLCDKMSIPNDDHDGYKYKEEAAAVVRFSVKKSEDADLIKPWVKPEARSSSGSGYYIGDKHFITNYHVIKNANEVWLQVPGIRGKFKGKVLFECEAYDLALVTIIDENFNCFWDSEVMPKPLRHEPEEEEEKDSVLFRGSDIVVMGYPKGNQSVTITGGIVSTFDYDKENKHRLRIQYDAPANKGNSGGPAFDVKSRKVIGVHYSSRREEGVVGFHWSIPASTVSHFLKAYNYKKKLQDGVTVNDKKPLSFGPLPDLGIKLKELTNKTARKRFLGNRADNRANYGCYCLISDVAAFSLAASAGLKEDDVLLEVDGKTILDTCEYEDRKLYIKLPVERLWTTKIFNENITLKILRKGEEMELKFPVTINKSPFIPHIRDTGFELDWVNIGGLYFVRLSHSLLRQQGISSDHVEILEESEEEEGEIGEEIYRDKESKSDAKNADLIPALKRLLEFNQVKEGEEIIFLAHSENVKNPSFKAFAFERLKSVNGVPIVNMKQLVTLMSTIVPELPWNPNKLKKKRTNNENTDVNSTTLQDSSSSSSSLSGVNHNASDSTSNSSDVVVELDFYSNENCRRKFCAVQKEKIASKKNEPKEWCSESLMNHLYLSHNNSDGSSSSSNNNSSGIK